MNPETTTPDSSDAPACSGDYRAAFDAFNEVCDKHGIDEATRRLQPERRVRVAAAGTSREVSFHLGVNRCGHIEDGVALHLSGIGAIVIAAEDLYRLAAMAAAHRQNSGYTRL